MFALRFFERTKLLFSDETTNNFCELSYLCHINFSLF